MTTSLIVFSGNDPQYLAIVWELANDARDRGENPTLLDLTSIVPGIGDTYHRGILKHLGRREPGIQLKRKLVSEGFTVIEPHPIATILPAKAEEGIRESVRSALISYARDPLPRRSRIIWSGLERRLRRTAIESFAAIDFELERHPSIDTVYLANGRFPHQRSIMEAALSRNRALRFYEKGEAVDTYWFEEHSTLDRITTQANVDSVLAHLSPEESLEVGQGWMNSRSSRGAPSNIYARFFTDDSGLEKLSKRKLIGFFTSSQDEFAALGPEWHVQEWADQWAAFDHALTHLEQFGFDFYLRVHPNFITKSHASFLRERRQILDMQAAHPALRIFWHDEQVNSYSLLEQSDAVVVWDSTVGLEASGRAIPVWEMAASYYDLYADVRTWFSSADDPGPEEFFYKVETALSLRFMAYLVSRDRPLPAEAIVVRNDLTPPPGIATALASIAVSGGAPTIAVAISAIADTVRHRRWGINRVALTRFLSRR